ncbi:MAG: hypothetical protein KDI50_10165 [Candidatus Competibacteraceae bacterium]|nr:hypothetical protein [Candidatus Competibacteraceae bacterium]
MTITLDLPQELEQELITEASRRKLSLSEYALDILKSRSLNGDSLPKTGADLVAYWQRENIIGSRPDIADSQIHARYLRRQAESRVEQ